MKVKGSLANCALAASLFASLSLAGCTHITEIRTEHRDGEMPAQSDEQLLADCNTGSGSADEVRNSIEDYHDRTVSFVEFTDQGWPYNNGEQMDAFINHARGELNDPTFARADFLVLVFVHGWHHNAHDNDCNVNEFRVMVHLTSERLRREAREHKIDRPQRVLGLYIGWRGEALDAPLLRYATILDRRSTAEHVAKGSVRELFAEVRKLQYLDQLAQQAQHKEGRVRTVVVGHSFGGLIAFHSISPALLNELTVTRPGPLSNCEPPAAAFTWPNQLILINPAFEASRFEAIYNAAYADAPCTYQPARPKMIVLTADNDGATGTFFPMFRTVTSLFEGYDSTAAETRERERNANLHAIGFVDRYKSHRLCLIGNRPVLAADTRVPRSTTPDLNSPVWVVSVTSKIIDGHNDFL